MAQTLGLHEPTVTMYHPAEGAGPMPVRVVPQGRALDGPLLLRAVRVGAEPPTSEVALAPGAGPGAPSTGTLQIDRPGAWEVLYRRRIDVPVVCLRMMLGAVAIAVGLVAAAVLRVAQLLLPGARRAVSPRDRAPRAAAPRG